MTARIRPTLCGQILYGSGIAGASRANSAQKLYAVHAVLSSFV